MNRDLKKKILAEQPLTAEESLRLDEALEGQVVAPRLMSNLDDPSPSLAWRSSLNERVLSASHKSRRQWSLRWFSGVTAAAALAVVAVVSIPRSEPSRSLYQGQHSVQSASNPGVEESLLSAHIEADLESGLGVSSAPTVSVSAGS